MIIKQGANENLYYTFTDHLGSVISLLNPDGTVAEKYSYDPWGRRRDPDSWTYDSIPAPTLIDRGFTGHEHLDEFGLINMNGRMYDPALGRFLSVDPYIQFPESAQSYNGYGYCLNNPLKYSDPSGMLAKARDESDAAFDAYFYWLCDGSMSFGNMFSGGGGGGGIGRSGFGGANENWVGEYMYKSNVRFYGYSYNWSTGQYYSRYTGELASPNEVLNNYILPNCISPSEINKELKKAFGNAHKSTLTAGPGGSFLTTMKNELLNSLKEVVKCLDLLLENSKLDVVGILNEVNFYPVSGASIEHGLVRVKGEGWNYMFNVRGGIGVDISSGYSVFWGKYDFGKPSFANFRGNYMSNSFGFGEISGGPWESRDRDHNYTGWSGYSIGYSDSVFPYSWTWGVGKTYLWY